MGEAAPAREGGLYPPGKRSLVGAGEILRALVSKELKVKYKRSVLGFFWSLVTPLALTGIYLFVFVYVYRVPQKDFILFLLSGLLPWQYFNTGLVAATNSIIDNAPMVRKVYFPRVLVPASTVASNLINFLMGLGLLIVIVLATGRPLWLYLHWLILAVLLETMLCFGAGLALCVWNVYLRDIRQIINILLLVLFFATPIVYDLTLVPERFRLLLLANPLTSIMHLYRAALFESSNPGASVVLLGIAQAALVLAFGWLTFHRYSPELPKEI